MVDILIAAGTVVVALCAALALFRIEARQHRTSLLKPASYKFGLLGMVVYLVMYGVLTIIEKVCFGISKMRFGTRDNLVYGPRFYWHPWNVFYEDYGEYDKEK